MNKEVLLSVSGTCAYLAWFLWVRGNHVQEGKPLLGDLQGNLPWVRFDLGVYYRKWSHISLSIFMC